MIHATDIAICILMGASLLVLMLESISARPLSVGVLDSPHIRLLSLTAVLAAFILIILDLYQSADLVQKPSVYLNNISSLFLLINAIIALFLMTSALTKIASSDMYFLLLASLALAISNVSTSLLLIKMLTSIGWLTTSTALLLRSTSGGKKAEIGLKMTFLIILVFLQFLFSMFLLSISQYPVDLANFILSERENFFLAFLGLMLLGLSGISLIGTPPFHFGHIDCADAGDFGVAFFFLSNSAILGCSLLVDVKNVLFKSGMRLTEEPNLLGIILIFGFVVLYLRALDQNRVRRTVAYIAASVGTLFSMSLLLGGSVLLPQLIFLLANYVFLSLTLFTLYGSLALMNPINLPWITWEDISGYGKERPLPTLTFLIALASIAGLPGTLGYFVKLSLIAPLHESLVLSGAIFLSIAIGAAFVMRVFVFVFTKLQQKTEKLPASRPQISLLIAAAILIILGFFPFVR